jgi:sRNA-binding regulator protein Hfq
MTDIKQQFEATHASINNKECKVFLINGNCLEGVVLLDPNKEIDHIIM